MDDVEGFSVYLVLEDGTRIPQYPNPHRKRHKDFTGTLGSRRIVCPPKTRFSIVLEIHEAFKLFSADGVLLLISIGEKSPQIPTDDEYEQFSWLQNNQMNIRGQHRFNVIQTWDKNGSLQPSQLLPLEMPMPNPNYATASAEWLVDKIPLPAEPGYVKIPPLVNPRSVAVWVFRAKVDRKQLQTLDEETRSITEPPSELRLKNTCWPKVVQEEWLKLLESTNGLPHVFEFVNIEQSELDVLQGEANPTVWNDFFEDRDDDSKDESEWLLNADGPESWGDQEYHSESDFRGTDGHENPKQLPRKRNRYESRARDPSKMQTAKEKSLCNTNSTGKKICEDEDGEEDERFLKRESIKEETLSLRDHRRTQEPTPPADAQALRETIQDLYSLTPDRDIRANPAVHAHENGTEPLQEDTAETSPLTEKGEELSARNDLNTNATRDGPEQTETHREQGAGVQDEMEDVQMGDYTDLQHQIQLAEARRRWQLSRADADRDYEIAVANAEAQHRARTRRALP